MLKDFDASEFPADNSEGVEKFLIFQPSDELSIGNSSKGVGKIICTRPHTDYSIIINFIYILYVI